MVALFALEMYGVFTDADTISGLTADVFHTNTTLGRGIFTVAWVAFGCWFGWHIWFWGRSVKNPDAREQREVEAVKAAE